MPASQTVTLESLRDYLDAMGEVVGKVDLRKPLGTVAFYFAAEARKNFDEGRSPDGVPWAALIRPSKRRGGSSAKPLRDKGILMASLVGRSSGHVERITDSSIEWGTNVDYASFHQQGTRRMVARPFIGITPTMEERAHLILIEYVQKLLTG